MRAETLLDTPTVCICAKCGVGVPQWSTLLDKREHDNPIWNTTEVYEDICGGRIIEVFRDAQIERCDGEEFSRGIEWTAEELEKYGVDTTTAYRPITLNKIDRS